MYKKIYRNMCFLSIVTLVFSLILVISACYTYFDDRLKEEIKDEVLITAALISKSDNPAKALSGTKSIDRRFTLISKEGDVLFDSFGEITENHAAREEISKARKHGIGSAERYSGTSGKKMYYCAVELNGGLVLRIAADPTNMPSMFYTILIAILFIAALIYILSAIVAAHLTESIVKPIENIDPFSEQDIESAYVEIQPFLRKIALQNTEINRQADKVTEQKARLQAIMDNINEGLVLIDSTASVLTINETALMIFDTEESEVKGQSYLHLTGSEQIRSVVKKALEGEKNNIMYTTGDKAYQIFYSPIREKGNITGAVMLLFDVTKRNEAEKIRREFTANVSHELKTPLTTIHGYAQIIDSGIAKPEDIDGFVKKIEKESSRLIVLINDIIELSHLDEDSGDTPKQNFSLRAVVSDVVENLSSKASQRDVTISFTGGDTTIYANPAQITELVYNLTDNAIKYNKPGGSVNVEISPKTLTVSDTGIGIPEKYTERIFERFFRVDKSHSKTVNGTGLGLSIVKHIAKVNEAEIKVSSTPGEGSTFTVIFR